MADIRLEHQQGDPDPKLNHGHGAVAVVHSTATGNQPGGAGCCAAASSDLVVEVLNKSPWMEEGKDLSLFLEFDLTFSASFLELLANFSQVFYYEFEESE